MRKKLKIAIRSDGWRLVPNDTGNGAGVWERGNWFFYGENPPTSRDHSELISRVKEVAHLEGHPEGCECDRCLELRAT